MNKILRYILLIFALGISLEMQSQSSGPATVSFSKDKNYVATLTPRNGGFLRGLQQRDNQQLRKRQRAGFHLLHGWIGTPGAAGGIPHFACGKGSDKHAGVRFP